MKITAIYAMDRNNVIGNSKNNNIPWKLSTDFTHFKANTQKKVLIMGRKTYDSIGKPLPGRRTIVVSKTMPDTYTFNLIVCRSISEAVKTAQDLTDIDGEIMICGGASIYKETQNIWTDIVITFVDAVTDGDIKIEHDLIDSDWRVVHNKKYKKSKKDEYDFTIRHYQKSKSHLVII